MTDLKYKTICRRDGIGRRAGLKIRSWQQGAGSTPAAGTKADIAICLSFFGDNMDILHMIINELKHMVIPCLITLPVIIAVRVFVYNKTKKLNVKREVIILLFWIYIAALLSVVFIPEYGIKVGSGSDLFHLPDFKSRETIILDSPIGWIKWKLTLGDYSDLVRNIVGNIIVFIPFGLLVPSILNKSGIKTILYGIFLSFFIEFTQLFMNRQSDIYDLLLNTLGAALGYSAYLLIKLIIKKRAKRSSACINDGSD